MKTDIKVLQFFENTTTPKDMARMIRRVNHILSLTILRNKNDDNPINPVWVEEGYYFLNEFAETLDPILED